MFWLNVGNPIPAWAPYLGNAARIIENHRVDQLKGGDGIAFPFKVYPGYQLKVFAQKFGSPRDLVFSPSGTLLAALPDQGKIVALLDTNQNDEVEEVKDV